MNPIIAKALNWLADQTGIRVLPGRLLHPPDRNVSTLKVPGYHQSQGHTCGFVAGLMILHYFRPGFPIERFYERIRPHTDRGVSPQRLIDSLRLYGVRVSLRTDLDFDGIMHAVDADRPITVVVRTRKVEVSHWIVIYGYGRKPNRVFVAGELPFQTQQVYPYGMFRAHFWAPSGFGLVCAGPKASRSPGATSACIPRISATQGYSNRQVSHWRMDALKGMP